MPWCRRVGSVLALTILPGCPDAPVYPVGDVVVRVIPEQATIGSAGGSVFVLVELDANTEAAGLVAVLRAEGATARPLPGTDPCSSDEGTSGTTSASMTDTGSASTTGAGESGEASDPESNSDELVLPASSFAMPTSGGVPRGTVDSAVTVDIEAGKEDVLIVVAVYDVMGGEACMPRYENLLGFAQAKIVRDDGEDSNGASGSSSSGSGGTTGADEPSSSTSSGDSSGSGGTSGSSSDGSSTTGRSTSGTSGASSGGTSSGSDGSSGA